MDFKPWSHTESKVALSEASKYHKTLSKKGRNDEEKFILMEKALKEKGFLRSLDEIKLFYETIISIQRSRSCDEKSNPSLKNDIRKNLTEDKSKGKDTEKSRVEISSTSTKELLSTRAGKDGVQVETQTTSKNDTNSLAKNLVNSEEKKETISVNSVMNNCKNVLEEVSAGTNPERLLTETPVQETQTTHEIEAIVNSKSDSLVLSKKKRKSTCVVESDSLVISKKKIKSTSGAVSSKKNVKQKILKITQDSCEEVGENNNKLYSQPTTHQMVNDDNDHNKPEFQTNRESIDNCRRTRSNSIDVEIPNLAIPTCTRPSDTTVTNAKEQVIIAGTNKRKSGDLKNKLKKTTPNKNNDFEKSLVISPPKEIADVENEISEIRVNKTKKGKKASNSSLTENITTKKLKTLDSLHEDQDCKSNKLKNLPSTHQDGDSFGTKSNKKLKTHTDEVHFINNEVRSAISTSQLKSPLTTSKSTGRMSPTRHEAPFGNSTTTRNIPTKGTENCNAAKIETEFKTTFEEDTQIKISLATNEVSSVDRIIQEVISHEIPIDTNKEGLSIVETEIFEEDLLDNVRTEAVIDAHNENNKVEIKTQNSLHKKQEVQTFADQNISQTIKKRGRKKKNGMPLISQKESKIPCRLSERKSIDSEKPTQHELLPSITTTLNDTDFKSNDVFNGAGNEIVIRATTSDKNENSFEQLVSSTLPNKEIVQETKLVEVDSKIKCSNIENVSDVWINESKNNNNLKSNEYNDGIKPTKSSGKLGNKSSKEPNKPFNSIQDNSDVCMIKDSNTTAILKPDTITDMNETRRRSTNSQIKTQFARRGSRIKGIKCTPKMIKDLTDLLKQTNRQIKEETKKQEKHLQEIHRVHEQLLTADNQERIICLKVKKDLTDQLKQTTRQIMEETKKQHSQQEKYLQELRRAHEQQQTWFVEILKRVGLPPSNYKLKT